MITHNPYDDPSYDPTWDSPEIVQGLIDSGVFTPLNNEEMKETEIIEGNKLIAEFVGLRFRGFAGGNPMTGIEYEWEAEVPDFLDHDAQILPLYDEDRPEEHFRFHTSWDWLMPVVEKIEKDMHVVIQYHACTISNANDSQVHRAATKIEAVWIAVVEFLKASSALSKA